MTSNQTIRPNPFLRGLTTIWRLPRMLLVGVVRLYRIGISPYFSSTCRYTPTCSEYAIVALKEYGALRGTILATWRILRCNPWGGHGHDPPAWPLKRVKGEGKSVKDNAEAQSGREESAQNDSDQN